MALQIPSPSRLLELPSSIRQRIYSHLLASHCDEATIINYTLTWNWLEHPSNSTFAGVPQLDLCRCPRQHRKHNAATEDHIYQRYKCHGPEVRFKSGREELWVPGSAYVRSGQINFPKPATRDELNKRPNGNVLNTCWMVYKEALPILYRGRNFLLLTGPCPRGRYQAYATQMFLARLGPLAKANVTMVSLIAQSYEEDCSTTGVSGAYKNLAFVIQHQLPSFETLCLNLWDQRLVDAARSLKGILNKDGAVICLSMNPMDRYVVDCREAECFEAVLKDEEDTDDESGWIEERDTKDALENTVVLKGDQVIETERARSQKKQPHRTTAQISPADTVWEEVSGEETDRPRSADVENTLERLGSRRKSNEETVHGRILKKPEAIEKKRPKSNISRLGRLTSLKPPSSSSRTRPIWQEVQRKKPDRTLEANSKCHPEKKMARADLPLRKEPNAQKLHQKSHDKEKIESVEGHGSEESNDEWSDAVLSPASTERGSLAGDGESSWEVI